MAVNSSRSMNEDFAQGCVDETYIQLTPDRANVENPPVDRLSWPSYRRAEQHIDHPFYEGHLNRAELPRERKTRYGSDPAY